MMTMARWKIERERDPPQLFARLLRLRINVRPKRRRVATRTWRSKRMRMSKRVSGAEQRTNGAKREKRS